MTHHAVLLPKIWAPDAHVWLALHRKPTLPPRSMLADFQVSTRAALDLKFCCYALA